MTPKNSAQLSVVSDQELQIDQVDIADLRIASWNARKTFDAARTEELKSSIEAHGIQVPLIVRPMDGPAYQIVAGHRRFHAALALWEKGNRKFEWLPCIIRNLTDDQAREIGLVDNLQREDVPALEEADAYAELQQRLGTAAAIAQRVGKEASYVARRLQLVSLAEQPRKALAERLITVEHAALLARLGEDEQNINLKWTLNPNSGIKEPVEETIKQRIQERDRTNRWAPWEPQSVLSLKHHIEEHVGRKLSRAPWDLDDATLIKDVPACNDCPSNTKHNDTLFGDLNIAAATCENGGCFEMKRLAFVNIQLSEATHKQQAGLGPAIRLSWKATTVKPRVSEAKAGSVMVDESGINLLQVFKRGQWVEAKAKSCEHVRLGVTVDWSDANDRGFMGGGEKLRKPGQLRSVCIAAKCKAHRKEWEKPKRENGDRKADQAKEEARRQAAIAETKTRMAVASVVLDAVKTIPAEALRVLVLGQVPNWGEEEKCANALLPGLKKIVQTARVDSVEFAKAVAVVSISRLNAYEYSPESDRKEFIADMKRLGYDASKAWDKPAEPKAAKVAAEEPAKKKPLLSAAARKRIAEAQKKRWGAAKKAAKKKGVRK